MQTKIVFSLWISKRLKELGFEPVKTMPNLKQPGLDCFVFLATPQLEEAFGQIVREGRRHD